MLKILKSKVLVSLLLIASLLICAGICVHAYDYSITTPHNISQDLEHYGSDYDQFVEYDLGTIFPFSDAMMTSQCGSTVAKYKWVFVSLNAPGEPTKTDYASSTSANSIYRQLRTPGYDYLEYGYANAEYRNGTSYTSPLISRVTLNVD